MAECICIRFGVQLHAIGSDIPRHVPLIAVRVHEQAHARTRRLDFRHDWTQLLRIGSKIPSMIGRESGRIIRNQSALGGTYSSYNLKELRIRIPFNVELDFRKAFEHRLEFVNIRFSDMPLVRPRMDGNAVGSCGNALLCCTDDVRYSVVPCIAKEGNLIDVDAEPGHYFSEYFPDRLFQRMRSRSTSIPQPSRKNRIFDPSACLHRTGTSRIFRP